MSFNSPTSSSSPFVTTPSSPLFSDSSSASMSASSSPISSTLSSAASSPVQMDFSMSSLPVYVSSTSSRFNSLSLMDHKDTTPHRVNASSYGLSALKKFKAIVNVVIGTNVLATSRLSDNEDSGIPVEHVLIMEGRALRYFKKARMAGLPLAFALCAFFEEFGMGGVDVNFANAERFYTEAANNNCGLAQARLAFLKTHGRPQIKINHTEAEKWKSHCKIQGETSVRWLRQASEAGVPAAQFCLALCHYNGISVPADDAEAFKWCEKAAIKGHPGAQNVLGNLYIEGSGCVMNATMGLRWYIRAAEKKEAAAIYNIGTLFERGLGVEEDTTQAFEWYVRASVFGSVNAQNVLGIFYEQGVGVHQNAQRAVGYYQTAAFNGHPHAQYNLGRCYHDGFGVAEDDTKAVMWFRMGAEQGHALSLLSMAVCSEAGIGVTENKGKAIEYYRRATKKDSVEARRRLLPIVAMQILTPARVLLAGRISRSTADSRALRASIISTGSISEPMAASRDHSQSYHLSSSAFPPLSSSSFRFSMPSPPASPPYGSSFVRISSGKPRQAPAKSQAQKQSQDDKPQTVAHASDFNSKLSTSRSDNGVSMADLPTEIKLHILSFIDDLQVLSATQFRAVVGYAASRKTLSSEVAVDADGVLTAAKSYEELLERVDVPVLKKACGQCRYSCQKIRHYINLLEERAPEGEETEADIADN
ncbi:ERAD-associated protein [Blyttiomyces sp. JEL0837]|nr:ERAD-associated protein [Blyttiomyces sp. JEL0837]